LPSNAGAVNATVAVVAPVAVAVPTVGASGAEGGGGVILIPVPIDIPDPNTISAIIYYPLLYLSENKKGSKRAFLCNLNGD
jgi:hypothetical protein